MKFPPARGGNGVHAFLFGDEYKHKLNLPCLAGAWFFQGRLTKMKNVALSEAKGLCDG
jgi:hypothetical protein